VRVLFLCTGNACRSQMAEGLCRALCGEALEAYSAGIEKHGLNPNAVAVMKEIGVDISAQESKTLEDLGELEFDFVITVCRHAHESCPIFPGRATVVHRDFDDPPSLARDAVDKQEALRHYRRVRDEIKAFVLGLPAELATEDGGERESREPGA